MKKLLILYLTILLAGCGVSNKNDSIKKITASDNIKKPDSYFMELGLRDETSIDDDQWIYRINNKQKKFSPTVTIKNGYSKSFKYRLFFLLDYKQVQITSKQLGHTYIDIFLKPGEEKKIEINTPELKDGLHDFSVILIRDPDNQLEENKIVSAPNLYLSKRVALVVNNDTKPVVNSKQITAINEVENDIYSVPYITGAPSEPYSKTLSLKPKEQIDNLYLNMGNQKENDDYVIVCFRGTKQVSIEKPFIKVSNIGNFSVPLNLENNNEEGNINIAILKSPYTTDSETLKVNMLQFTNLITLK